MRRPICWSILRQYLTHSRLPSARDVSWLIDGGAAPCRPGNGSRPRTDRLMMFNGLVFRVYHYSLLDDSMRFSINDRFSLQTGSDNPDRRRRAAHEQSWAFPEKAVVAIATHKLFGHFDAARDDGRLVGSKRPNYRCHRRFGAETEQHQRPRPCMS